MNKDIFQRYNKQYKTNIAIALALVMLAGFLTSRAVLSIGVILFGVNGLVGIHPREWLKNKWWLLGCAWVAVYIISGLWSENLHEWNLRVTTKLPILLLPIAFSSLPKFSRYQLKVFTIGATFLFLGSIAYSLSYLISDPDYYIEQYRFSKVLPTLASKDYIRYSLSIALFVIWCINVWGKLQNKAAKWFVGITILLLILHLHVIAVKTGILVFYLFMLLMAVYMTVKRKSILGIVLMATLVVSAIGAYKYVPTFENKIDYFRYSIKIFKQNNADVNYSDIGRLVSYDVAIHQLKGNLLVGTGIGDMWDVMRDGYKEMYPHVPFKRMLKPHNQILIVLLGCGLPTLLIFMLWSFYPLRWIKKSRDGFFMLAMWTVLWIPMMVEPFLEGQLGIFLYLFFLLMIAHNLKPEADKT